ncbi:MAG: DPP IV N-terminal domain-containing protein [Balneolaceae bacterium]|nr:DPP IV N-terminal domain-containing protein [Balneolaceae bacterium]
MKKHFTSLLIWMVPALLVVAFQPVSYAQDIDKAVYSSLEEALGASGQLGGSNGPSNVQWIDGGDRYSYTSRTQDGPEIRVYDPATGDDELTFKASDYTFPGSDEPFEYRSFQWSKDFKFIVFETNFRPIYRYSGVSDYYMFSVEDETLEPAAMDAFTAELSPDGTKMGYEHEGNLFVLELATGESTQLTFDAEENVYNGRFGWVYEEEFSIVQGWSWSYDSEHLAYWQTDERDVPLFVSTDYSGSYPEFVEIPYPKVGATNPSVKIGVVNVDSGEKRWMDLDLGDGYVPRIYWTSDPSKLAVQHMNRAQNHLSLYMFDINTGQGDVIMEEIAEDGWIDVYDFFAGISNLMFFPPDREEFFWISDSDGWSHVYRYDYEGNLLNQVTQGEWEVTKIHAVNSETEKIYFESTEASPLERQLYSITFDGGQKSRITQMAGRHDITMGPNGSYFITRVSNVETPKQVELWATASGGQKLETLVANESVNEYIAEHSYSPRELTTITTSDGRTLDAYVIKPFDFDPTQEYPMLLSIYGGPGAQGVYNQFETSGWNQYLAQLGFVIVNVNNRGTGGYGAEFEKSVYKQLGLLEAEDFAETATYMGAKEWVDEDRMAIRGHSYGGFMASLTPVLYPDVFDVAIVGAPVTDWRLYDTIYTERYMGLLEDNLEGYKKTSVATYAENLEAKMLIAHSSMDENVHVQNTMQAIQAFTDAGKDVDLRIYPAGAHGVAYNYNSYVLLYETYTNLLKEEFGLEANYADAQPSAY